MNIYTILVKNDMFGYTRDQHITISADSVSEALSEAQKMDIYADVSLVSVALKCGTQGKDMR